MENLRDYTVKHFTDEEQYMESINYKKLFTQKVQHLKFIHKLDEFIEHHNDEIKDQDEQIKQGTVNSVTCLIYVLMLQEQKAWNSTNCKRRARPAFVAGAQCAPMCYTPTL